MEKFIICMVMRVNGQGRKVRYMYRKINTSNFLIIDSDGDVICEGCFTNDSYCPTNKTVDDSYELVFDSDYAIYDDREIIGMRSML